MSALGLDPVVTILLIPIAAAAILALVPDYRLGARINMLACLVTLLVALSLFATGMPPPGTYLLVDELNIVFIALNTFVGFTTSVFSASYIGHELATGRLTPTYCASTTPCTSFCSSP
jgi:hydrogenase-4 component F